MLSFQTDDLTKQSMPFSYLTFECQSQDGAAHDVQVYSDISAGASQSSYYCIITLNFSQNGYRETGITKLLGTRRLPVLLSYTAPRESHRSP